MFLGVFGRGGGGLEQVSGIRGGGAFGTSDIGH